MAGMSRRKFIQTTAAFASTFAISDTWHRVLGANETIRVGIAGIHGRGESHINALVGMPEVEIAYLIDPDASLFDGRVKQIVDKGGRPPKCVQ
ncbi:MAG: gfo/Idh/MocA family oxidoreductase, partial [Armatimonadota bacterium]